MKKDHICINGARKTMPRDECPTCLVSFKRRYNSALGTMSPEQVDKFIVCLDAELQKTKAQRDKYANRVPLGVAAGCAIVAFILGLVL